MYDITKRLRDGADALPQNVLYSSLKPLLLEAADVIEEQRTVRAGAMAQVQGVCDINDALEAENKRLRATLKELHLACAGISQHTDANFSNESVDAWRRLNDAQVIARDLVAS